MQGELLSQQKGPIASADVLVSNPRSRAEYLRLAGYLSAYYCCKTAGNLESRI
jgi:hypothetical protein